MGAFLTTDRYATVLAWADWHAGVVSRSELAALGIPPTVIASWLRTKRLTRIHRGPCASCAATACPRPSGLNQRVDRFVVDAVYPEVPLAVELDGRAYHARCREMTRDRHRDADLQGPGYRVLRLVWEDLYDEQAAATIRRLTKLLGLRGA